MKDYYNILGVSHAASPGEIKAAYRRLAVMYHPDKNSTAEAEHLIKEINEAYEVLGDPEKKKLYDQQFVQIVSSILTESDPQPPAHRDPRYRRRRPSHYAPAEKGPTTHDLMRQYLPRMLWICRIGFSFTLLFAVDFFLPYQSDIEGIKDIYRISSVRNAYKYDIIVTDRNRRIKIYDYGAYPFLQEASIKITRTLIFSTHMYVSDISNKKVVRLGYVYRSLLFFPVILFLTSLFGILFRKGVEFPFNLTIVSAILLIINLFLIL